LNPSAFVQIINSGFTIGANTELIPEATDALYSSVPSVDGKSGDIDFPFGKMKPLATVGEYDVCTGTFDSFDKNEPCHMIELHRPKYTLFIHKSR
jgi:hypothetical protein